MSLVAPHNKNVQIKATFGGWYVQERVRIFMFPWPRWWVTRARFSVLAEAWAYAKTL